MANPPAGWHPDPLSRHAQRYWDGNQWTEHVADQSGNMSTDPLDGGQSASQQSRADQTQADQATSQWDGGRAESSEQGGWGQSETATAAGAGADAGASSWGSSTDQATTGTETSGAGASWGSDRGETSTSSWDDTPSEQAAADPVDSSTETADADEDLPSWQSSDTRDTDGGWGQPADTTPADTTTEPTTTEDAAWGAGAGAAGAGTAAAAGSVAAADHDRAAPVDDQPDTGDSIEHVDSGSATASHADVSHPTVAVVTVGTGVVVRNGHVVAASPGLDVVDSDHPGATSITGDGTVHVGAGGREITVLDVPGSGLTIADAALVAHSAGLTRAAAADGIVGYDGTSVSGGGWVAVAAVGGAVEVSPVGGVDVSPAALVAWSSDLDVSHAENVTLSGRGTVLVSSVTS